jgi:hypothetical protein
MSLGIGPHDQGCECARCTSRRAAAEGRSTVFICTECQSVHFNIARPLQFSDTWMACCEGCGAIYDLLPSGDTQTRNP